MPLAAAHFCMHADRVLPVALAPVLRTHFELSDGALGLLQGPAFILPYAIATLAAGAWLGGRDPRWLVIVAVVAWSGAVVLFALAGGYGQLVVARAALGLAQAAFAPAALLLLTSLARPAPALAVSVFTAGSAMGRSGGLLVVGLLLLLIGGASWADDAEPWRMACLWLLVPNLLLVPMLVATLRHGAAPAPTGDGLRGALSAMAQRPRAFACLFIAASAVILIVHAGGAWAGSVLNRDHGLTPGGAATAAGLAILLSAPLGHLLAGGLLARSPRAHGALITGGAIAAALAAVLLAVQPSFATATFAIAVLSAGGGVAAATALIALQAMVPPERRFALNALYLATVSLVGLGLGPLLTGIASDRLSPDGAALAPALALVVAVAAAVASTAAAIGWRDTMISPQRLTE